MSKIFNNAQKVQNISGNPNLIINGNFNIWQRGPQHSSTGYNADRWVGIVSGGASFSKINAVNLRNSSFALRAVTTQNSSSFTLKQIIETNNVVFIRGKTVSLSFYAKIPASYKGQDNRWTGLLRASVFASSSAIDSILGATEITASVLGCVLSSNWQRFSITFDIPDTTQTLSVDIRPEQSSLMNNSVCDITQVKLELGSVPTNYDDILYTHELSKCQRYYQKMEIDLEAGSQNNQSFGTTIPLFSEMRTPNPSITFETQNNKGINNLSTTLTSNKQALKIKGISNSNNIAINSSLVIDDELVFGAVPAPISNAQSIRNTANDTMSITWTEPNNYGLNILSYFVKYGDSPTNLSNSITTFTPSGIVSGVLDHITYYYTIQAQNALGFGSPSATYASGPPISPPSPPSGLSGVWGLDNHNISWVAPVNDGGSPVLGYSIQRSTSADFLQNQFFSTSSTTSSSLTNPQTSNNYYLRVAAFNVVGTGNYSSSILLQRTAPSAPTSLSTRAINSGVVLSWSTPLNNGGSSISGYVINHSTTSGFASAMSANVGPSFAATITGLANNTLRYFRVAAVNGIGTSAWSSSVFATPNQPPTTAAPPQNLVPTWIDHSTVGVLFTSPRTDGGSPVINYNIQLSTNSGFTQNVVNFNTLNPATDRTYTISVPTGHMPGFHVRALAVNAIGSGAYSSGVFLSKGLPPAPINFSATAGNRAVNLTWSPSRVSSGVAVTGFSIDSSTSILFNTFVGSVNVSNVSTFASTGLNNGTLYYFRMRSLSASGAGPYTSAISGTPLAPATVPSVPPILRVIRSSATSLSVSFEGSLNNGGSAITGYRLGYSIFPSNASIAGVTAANYFSTNPTNYINILPEQAGTTQVFQIPYNSGIVTSVQARNTIGNSDWSNLIFVPQFLSAPGNVTGLAYTEIANQTGSGIGTIRWNSPTDWGGEPDDTRKTYRLNIDSRDGGIFRNFSGIPNNINGNNSFVVSGLRPGLQHLVSISSHNSRLSSEYTNLSFVPSVINRVQPGGWTLSVSMPTTSPDVVAALSWDYFTGYLFPTKMNQRNNRADRDSIWISGPNGLLPATPGDRSVAFIQYHSDLWLMATFPGDGAYISRVEYATPFNGIAIPAGRNFNASQSILTEAMAIRFLDGATLQFSNNATNWIDIHTLRVRGTHEIYSYSPATPIFCKYMRIFSPLRIGNRLAVGFLNFI